MTRFVSSWQATCSIPGHKFQLTFKSQNGDPTDDDMNTSIHWDGSDVGKIALKQALFVAGRVQAEAVGQCDKITGVLLPSGDVLLLLRRDERPIADHLLAVLLNGKTGRVLDTVEDLGVETEETLFKEESAGIRLRLSRKWCQVSKQVEPEPFPEWVTLIEKNRKLQLQWESKSTQCRNSQ